MDTLSFLTPNIEIPEGFFELFYKEILIPEGSFASGKYIVMAVRLYNKNTIIKESTFFKELPSDTNLVERYIPNTNNKLVFLYSNELSNDIKEMHFLDISTIIEDITNEVISKIKEN